MRPHFNDGGGTILEIALKTDDLPQWWGKVCLKNPQAITILSYAVIAG
jgi:hypothetical protein